MLCVGYYCIFCRGVSVKTQTNYRSHSFLSWLSLVKLLVSITTQWMSTAFLWLTWRSILQPGSNGGPHCAAYTAAGTKEILSLHLHTNPHQTRIHLESKSIRLLWHHLWQLVKLWVVWENVQSIYQLFVFYNLMLKIIYLKPISIKYKDTFLWQMNLSWCSWGRLQKYFCCIKCSQGPPWFLHERSL